MQTLTSPSMVEDEPPSPPWSLATRIAFRFSFVYLLPCAIRAMFFDVSITRLFLSNPDAKFIDFDPWQFILPWMSAHIFQIKTPYDGFADSDNLTGVLLHVTELILALIATLVWSYLDRKRPNYRQLYFWFSLYLRFVLAITLISYGFDKVFPLQFGNLTPSRLVPQVGDLSPFDLIWTFMAASKPYTIFSGALEVLAGVLLLIPRLELIGALVSAIVLSNVVALNLTYEIPVKIFSAHLLLISIFLSAPAILRITQLLVLRRTPFPVSAPPQPQKSWAQKAVQIGPIAMATLAAIFFCFSFAGGYKTYTRHLETAKTAEKLPFYGVWEVDAFNLPQGGQSALFTHKLAEEMHIASGDDQWIRLFFETPKSMQIQIKNRQLDYVKFALDQATGTAQISDDEDPAWKVKLTLQTPTPTTMNMQGTINGVPVSAKLHRVNVAKFRLTGNAN
jgi:uncharacterized membrane protein YphA (DoxX/SURF4 family)